jgi:hypothetical protein
MTQGGFTLAFGIFIVGNLERLIENARDNERVYLSKNRWNEICSYVADNEPGR